MPEKAHGIIALLLAPIDGKHFDYHGFIIAYDKVADTLKCNEIECVEMDKMNCTAPNIIYKNWFKRTDWQRLPKPRNISMKFFHPEYLMGW